MNDKTTVSSGAWTFPLPWLAVLIMALLPWQSQGANPEVTKLGGEPPKQILFVGNSYLYYGDSLHNHVRRLAEAAEIAPLRELKFRSITISGGEVGFHPLDHYLTPNAIGYPEPFEVVILQGHSAAALDEDRSQRFRAAVETAAELIGQHGAKPALYMTHAYAEGHKRYAPDNTAKIEALYVEMANQIDALVIPVGLAFVNSLQRRPELALHHSFDHSHPNPLGTYLAACVVYASLYGKPVSGNPYDYYGSIDQETAAYLQEVADATVSEFFGR
ncbi:MAG: DUF4886 domain-containing protein [Candidatus Competibacterales bacterium]